MATPYQFNFPDMIRFFDDLKYVLQSGGVSKLFQKGGEFPNLFDIVMMIIKLIVALTILYLVYIIIFGGYPRFIVSIFTGSLYHKELIDPFIKENGLVKSTIDILLENSNAVSTFDKVYSTDLATKLKNELLDLDKNITNRYNKFKPTERYYEALKDYYLFFDTVKLEAIPNSSNSYKIISPTTVITTPTTTTKVSNQDFYVQQLGYLTNQGLYDAKGKGNDEQLLDMYNIDKKQNFQSFSTVASIKISFLKISDMIRQMVDIIKSKPYLSFIIIPENDKDKDAFNKDYGTYKNAILDGTVYNSPNVSNMNRYTWYLIEYFQYKRDKDIYNKFKSILENKNGSIKWNQEEIHTIRKYINTSSSELRKKMQGSIFGRKLVKLQPKLIDPSRDVREESYPDNQRCNAAFFTFIEQHPIFCNIYFSDKIPNPDNKNVFYQNVMKAYDWLYMDCRDSTNISVESIKDSMLDNIKKNGNLFVKFVNSVNIFNLYMNEYKSKIVKTYKDHYYNANEFFNRLFTPYFEDFVNNRMKVYIMKTFSAGSWNASYNKFLVQWAKLGQLLKTLMGSIAGSFHQETNVQEPQSVV